MVAVSDTGPLIWLGRYDLLRLLKGLYSKVLIPEAVYREAVTVGVERGHKDAFLIEKAVEDGWVEVCKSTVEGIAIARKAEGALGVELGGGEREAIALALGRGVKTVLTDDEETYFTGRRLGLEAKGVLYILLRSVRKGVLRREEAGRLVNQMLKDGLWLSPLIIQKFHETLDRL